MRFSDYLKYNNVLYRDWTWGKLGFLVFIGCVVFASCRVKDNSLEALDVEGKRALVKEKREAIRQLEAEIDQLNQEIVEIDSVQVELSKSVSAIPIVKEEFERHVDIQGRIISDDFVNVVAEVPGRIVEIKFSEGDWVQKGQLVARLDLESIKKQIDEVQISLSLAEDIFQRQERLWNQKIGSEVQYLQAKNNKERLEKSLESLNFQLSRSNIYAPISGVVDREFLKTGEVSSPGMPIIQLLNTSKVKVEADLPERYLAIVKRGMSVKLTFPSINEQMEGRVHLLGRSIDEANRTLKVEIRPLRRNELLKPNLLTEIRMLELRLEDVIAVPAEYVLQEVDGTEYVYLVEEGDGNKLRASKRYVETGETSEGRIVIVSGLEGGETMVAKGSRNVSDGELLEVLTEES